MDARERPWRQPASKREPPAAPALQWQPVPWGKEWLHVSISSRPSPLSRCCSLCFAVVISKKGLGQLYVQACKLWRAWKVLGIYPSSWAFNNWFLNIYFSSVTERLKFGPPDSQIIVLLTGMTLPPAFSVYIFFPPVFFFALMALKVYRVF